MFAIEKIERIVIRASGSVVRDKVAPLKAITGHTQNENATADHTVAVFSFLGLFDDALEEIENCEFRRDGRKDQFRKSLNELRFAFMEAIAKGDDQKWTGWLATAGREIPIMVASLTEAAETEIYDLDRPAFLQHTQELISDVEKWPIEEYAKRSLLLSLEMIQRQVSAENLGVSDSEVRRKIKAVVASFAVEFSILDKEFETKWEKFVSWARLGYKGASTPLGLTADASAVVGLLPKP